MCNPYVYVSVRYRHTSMLKSPPPRLPSNFLCVPSIEAFLCSKALQTGASSTTRYGQHNRHLDPLKSGI